MGKILVTGCSGFIGNELVNQLIKKNFKVIGIDCKDSNLDSIKNFQFIKLDLSKKKLVILKILKL